MAWVGVILSPNTLTVFLCFGNKVTLSLYKRESKPLENLRKTSIALMFPKIKTAIFNKTDNLRKM